MKIPVFSPIIGEKETEYVNDCLRTHWISQGSYVKDFENEFSQFCGCRHGIVTSSGTAALHLAGIILGLEKDDEVLVSSSTNMASAFSMVYCGARPIPVDIEIETWQMDVSKIEAQISSKTKAIMVVHLFGHPVDMDPVMELAVKYNLKVIEDCAEAHGAEYKGTRVGSFGDVACFSFYSNKIITTGEGGMVVTNSSKLAEKARAYSNFCYGKEQKFLHEDVGYNYRMSNIHAALGLGQLRRIDEILARKQYIYDRYRNNLTGLKGFHLPTIRDWAKSVLWMFNAYLSSDYGMDLPSLRAILKERGIETREAFVPINKQPVFLKDGFINEDDCPAANYIMNNGLYLPSGLNLKDDEIDYVCDVIHDAGPGNSEALGRTKQ